MIPGTVMFKMMLDNFICVMRKVLKDTYIPTGTRWKLVIFRVDFNWKERIVGILVENP